MALLTFNLALDKWKQRLLQFACEPQTRDHLSRSIFSYVDVKLTAAQMDTLNATPVSLVPAPGVGKINVVEQIVTYVAPGATPFELGSGTLDFKYTDGSGAKVATSVPNAQVESATATQYRSIQNDVVPVSNAAIVASASADVTAGDGAVYLRIWYRTVLLSHVGVLTELT